MRDTRGLMRRAVVALGACLFVGSVANANVGTGLPLDDYVAGTEATNNTIVSNGGFENVSSGQPVGWTLQNSHQVGGPLGANIGNSGNFAAQGNLGAADPTTGYNGYSQVVNLLPNTTYVLSAYMWNFGLNFDLAVAEVRDSSDAFVTNIALTRQDASGQDPGLILDGSRGVFGFRGFSSGAGGNFTVLVKFDLDETVAGTRPNVAGQLDNVAITPFAEFSPPRAVPEPTAALGLATVATAALIRRRRA